MVALGAPHHITQRGNNRQDVLLAGEDRRFYLEALREDSRRYGPHILGYCLMANHVHLVVVPERENTLARAMQRTHSRYAQRFNRLYGRSGCALVLAYNQCTQCPRNWRRLIESG